MNLIDTLKALAITVRNEKKKEANSAVRIGDLFIAIIDFIKNVQSGEIRQDGVDSYNDTSEGKTSLLNTYPKPELNWTVLVRNDETNGGKASLYKWNGLKWVNLETIMYEDDIRLIINSFRIVQNDKYIYAIEDSKGAIIYGIRWDGTHVIPKGIPRDVQKRLRDINISFDKLKVLTNEALDFKTLFSSIFSIVSDENNLYKVVDKNGKLLARIALDGTFIPTKLKLPKDAVIQIKKLISSAIQEDIINIFGSVFTIVSDENSLYKILDKKGKMLARISLDGTFIPTKLKLTRENISEIKGLISSATDSIVDNKNIYQLPFPERAVTINIEAERFPISKEDKIKAVFHYADYMGNRFQDTCTMKGQGSSSALSERISLAIDFDNIKVSFGSMPLQDSFHIKSYVWDKLRGVSVWAYDYATEVRNTLPFGSRYPNDYLKTHTDAINGGNGKLENELPSGANFHSRGFPARVYLNGVFKGMYCPIYKKDRANYEHKKDNDKHIHLDGVLNVDTLWNGVIDWSMFEVRNPKGLLDIEGNKYDGDSPKELSNNDVFTKLVKDKIVRLSNAIPDIKANPTKEKFEEYFLPIPMIDYLIRSNVCYNYDGFSKNWQWLTWDGLRFTVSDHDWDTLFGMYFLGTFILKDSTTAILGTNINLPTGQLIKLYKPEIDARYKELRDNGILSVEYITDSLSKWMDKVGYENYKEDFGLYPETPSNRASGLNSEYWELVANAVANVNYDPTKNYTVGETVVLGVTHKYRFRCIKDNKNQPPIDIMYSKYPEQMGYYESLWRINAWLKERFVTTDKYFNYQ